MCNCSDEQAKALAAAARAQHQHQRRSVEVSPQDDGARRRAPPPRSQCCKVKRILIYEDEVPQDGATERCPDEPGYLRVPLQRPTSTPNQAEVDPGELRPCELVGVAIVRRRNDAATSPEPIRDESGRRVSFSDGTESRNGEVAGKEAGGDKKSDRHEAEKGNESVGAVSDVAAEENENDDFADSAKNGQRQGDDYDEAEPGTSERAPKENGNDAGDEGARDRGCPGHLDPDVDCTCPRKSRANGKA